MSIFEFSDYRKYLKSWIFAQPKAGYGVSKKISRSINISSVLMSQILKGTRELNNEQAFLLCDFLQHSELERKYFLSMVSYSRAGLKSLKSFYEKEMRMLRMQAREVKSRIATDIQLSSEAQARFYSHWSYSAIRLLTSIPEFQTLEAVSDYLRIPKREVQIVLDFLCQNHLCIEEKGKYRMGPQRTHLDSDSPYVVNRQVQWRMKGFERMNSRLKDDLFYTAPLTISLKDYQKVREMMLEFVQNLTATVKDSESEQLACVNIDFFKVGKEGS